MRGGRVTIPARCRPRGGPKGPPRDRARATVLIPRAWEMGDSLRVIRRSSPLPLRFPGVKRREGGQKRKLGRNPRVPFSSTQLAALEARFRQSQYLSSCDVAELSSLLNLTETRNLQEPLRHSKQFRLCGTRSLLEITLPSLNKSPFTEESILQTNNVKFCIDSPPLQGNRTRVTFKELF
ncbi:homeobox protein MSX-2-like [Penaeus chinensis]|uniref:homeobox protein MSX-2-like n=1 Tax=Penaeus chinensis TaxID=139456 RepID=UPI001FB69D49|nr:homeobox protein MSX-2-like [Penaeus chinensis]